MKALIVDPALHSMGGHHYNAVLQLQRELARLDVHAPCLGSRYADSETVKKLACTPIFTSSVYGRDYSTRRAFRRSVEETSAQLSLGLRNQGAPPDLLVLPCCDQVLAAALARHLRNIRFASPPHIVLWLLYAPNYLRPEDDPQVGRQREEYREAFAELKASIGGAHRIQAYCETQPMAAYYANLLDLDIEVMAGPGLLPPRRRVRKRILTPDGLTTVACIGFANRPKGYRLLPNAVRHVLECSRNTKFAIHGVVVGSDAEDEQPAFLALSKLGGRVSVRQDVLTQAEYQAWLEEADLLLLPYDPAVYRSRGSGVFTEARALGIPIVATAGCAFAQPAFDQGWGMRIVDYSGAGIGRAVLSALEQLQPLTMAAAAAASRTNDDLGQTLQTALDRRRAEPTSGWKTMFRGLQLRHA